MKKPFIRLRREELGLSRENLARMARVSLNTIAQLETATRPNPTLEVCKKLSGVLGVSIDELFKDMR